mmetsp:Transcript_20491/g.48492  ORF Transcript_20491/g.48492 Transcript_20491/m.48492 type:complete len:100 (+) Transcript_20491:1266-1565(+)
MPHKWRRPANAHTVIHKPAAVGGRGAGPPPGAPDRPPGQADEEPHLPPVVRQLRQMRTLQHAAMLEPANNPMLFQHLCAATFFLQPHSGHPPSPPASNI